MINIVAKILLLVGSLLSIHASWLPAKGWLSQQLIQYSWQQSMANYQQQTPQQSAHQLRTFAVKPWPWADTFPIGELSIKRLHKKVVILNGGDPTTLAFSAGAVAPFNKIHATKPFVIAGHRDSHFAFLENIIMKDVISMTDPSGINQLYQVEAIEIVDASKGPLPVLADNSNLILITCYPFNSIGSDTNERYVITAKRL